MDQNLLGFFKSSLSCTICLEIFTNPHTIQCGHTFCGGCLKQWLDHRLHCPMCRKNILQEPVPNLIMMEQIEKISNSSTDSAVRRMDYEWKKYVKREIRDIADGVDRCMFCHWEIVEDYCRCNSILDTGALSDDDFDTDNSPLSDSDNNDFEFISQDNALNDMYQTGLTDMQHSYCDCNECARTDYSDESQDFEYYGSP